jgi:hypothetical protein
MTPVEFALAACWLLVALHATFRSAVYLWGLDTQPPADSGPFPPVLVLLPVRSADAAAADGVRACLAGLAAQDYRGSWRAVVVFENADDPAWGFAQALSPSRVPVRAAAPPPGRAQKLHNLLAGLATRRPAEAIVVTLDADTRPPRDFLAALTRPLRQGRAEAASGYRWMVGEGLAGRILALADRAPATTARKEGTNLAWGGATALSAAALARIDLPRLWDTAISDDLTLTVALREADLPAWTPRRVLVPTPVSPSWPELAAFGRRQYLLLRLHVPGHWLIVAGVLLVPAAGSVACLLAAGRGSVAALLMLGGGVALQQIRAGIRAEIGRRVLPADAAAAVRRTLPLDRLLLPLVPLVQIPVFVASACGRRVRWGQRDYLVEAPDRVRLLAPGSQTSSRHD